jgi:hypothetical protein
MSEKMGAAEGAGEKRAIHPSNWIILHCGVPGISRRDGAIGTKLFMTRFGPVA